MYFDASLTNKYPARIKTPPVSGSQFGNSEPALFRVLEVGVRFVGTSTIGVAVIIVTSGA